MPTFKNAKGGAWIQGEVGNRSVSRFQGRRMMRSLRKGGFRSRPIYGVPLFPGTLDTSNRDAQVQNLFPVDGSVDELLPWQSILFAITPELSENASYSLWIPGLGQAGANPARYRVVGLDGAMHFFVTETLNDPATDPGSQVGVVDVIWAKVERQNDPSASVAANRYPWVRWDQDWATNTNLRQAANGFVPRWGATGTAGLEFADGRYRVDVMRRYCVPWQLRKQYIGDVTGTLTGGTGDIVTNQLAVVGAGAGISRIPVPKRIMANVGRGEALCCFASVVSMSNVATGSSPVGHFHSTLRVKMYELD